MHYVMFKNLFKVATHNQFDFTFQSLGHKQVVNILIYIYSKSSHLYMHEGILVCIQLPNNTMRFILVIFLASRIFARPQSDDQSSTRGFQSSDTEILSIEVLEIHDVGFENCTKYINMYLVSIARQKW